MQKCVPKWDFEIEIVSGKREVDFEYDGVSTNKVEYGVVKILFYKDLSFENLIVKMSIDEKVEEHIDDMSPSIVRDFNKCILCRRCVAACDMQAVSVIGAANRGFATTITTAFDTPVNEVACIYCGQCINVCPTGALTEKDYTDGIANGVSGMKIGVFLKVRKKGELTRGIHRH